MSQQEPQSLGAAAARSFGPPAELNWQRFNLVAGVLAAIGIIGFIVALAMGEDDRVWQVYLVNLLFFAGIAQGGVLVSCGYYLTQGRWARNAIHFRLAEAAWPFLLLVIVLFWGVFVGRDHLFPWISHPVPKKAVWLNVPAMFGRDFGILVIMAGMSWWFVRASRGPAAIAWAEDPTNIEMPPPIVRRLAPIIGILFIYLYSVLSWDLIMSLSPLWHSTLFGWWWFEMCFWSGITASAFIAANYSTILGPGNAFGVQTMQEGDHAIMGRIVHYTVLHDYGKFVFAFSIFWMYLGFAQYLVIWYGDIPSETFFIVVRFWHWPWFVISWLSPFLVWVVPFFVLLGVRPKTSPAILRSVSFLGLLGVWITNYIMVVPSLSPNQIPLGWVEACISLGFLGLFMLCAAPGLKLTAQYATGVAE